MDVDQVKTIIDRLLDAVEQNPYADFQSERCTSCIKTVHFEQDDIIAIPRDIDLIYGIQHHYGKPLICKIVCTGDGSEINKFTISTDEIVWILNGTPIINRCLQYQEVNMYFTTTENVDENIYIEELDFYGAMLDDVRNAIVTNSFIQCVVDDYNCFRALSGLGGLYTIDNNTHDDTAHNIEELTRTLYDGSIMVFIYREPLNATYHPVLK